MDLDDDLTTIKDRLCWESSKLEVIPIIGMGGIGKTTLAKCAYDDALIMEYFDIRAWVTVSQAYSVGKILSRLVDSLKKLLEKNKMPMAEKVYKCLKGRRYLIVLDDVWSTKVWDDLRSLFPNDHNGSRIMFTTRLFDVAAYPISEGSLVHEMKFMDENQSWNLLQHKVFTNGQDCPPELEDIGKAIAQSCSGLPLAVVLVAGILATIAKTRASWKEIAENVISVVDGQIEKILSLSYTHLPHHLRACLLYIGGFPEDYEIRASRLIKLWVAEGFLKCEHGCKRLEEEAEECLEDLVRRRLVLVSRKFTGEIKSCSLHDMVRDLCIRKAQEEKFLLHVMDRYNLKKNIKNKRRVTISHPIFKKFQGPNIHTFLYLRLLGKTRLPAFIGNFKLLRVLDVVCSYVEVLPSQLFELIHLRYLALGSPDDIPSAISNLQNLQILIINPKYSVLRRNLPMEIWRMQQLRHLVFPFNYKLLNPVDGSTLPLENLQTLSGALDPACSKKILKIIPNLKKLEIHFGIQTDHVPDFMYLDQLEKLKLDGGSYCQWGIHAFPRTLKKLSLVDSFFSWSDMSVIGSLPHLQVLKLRGSSHYGPLHTWKTADGEFPQLRLLLIRDARLGEWITESSHFPRLECLVLRCCWSLREIPDGIRDIPTLELIDVSHSNKSLVDSAKQIQEEQQQDYGNYTLQVRCYHARW
ncbi:hypothetical protein ACS0TY_004816 [Phlomoides rotata]